MRKTLNPTDILAVVDRTDSLDALRISKLLARYTTPVDTSEQDIYADIIEEESNLDYSTEKIDYADALNLDNFDKNSIISNWAQRYLGTEIRAFMGFQYPTVHSKNLTKVPLYLNINESTAGGVGPHGLIAGKTGTGKSSMLKGFIFSIAAFNHPEMVGFILVDFKGGITFAGCQHFPHTIATISNLEEDQETIARLEDIVKGIIYERQRIFKDLTNSPIADGVIIENLIDYNKLRKKNPSLAPMPYIFVIIDEFTQFLKDDTVSVDLKKRFQELMDYVARIGRSAGVGELLSTQEHVSSFFTQNTLSNITWGISLFQISAARESRKLTMNDEFISKYDSAFDALKTPGDFFVRYPPSTGIGTAYAKCRYPDLKLPYVRRTRTVTSVDQGVSYTQHALGLYEPLTLHPRERYEKPDTTPVEVEEVKEEQLSDDAQLSVLQKALKELSGEYKIRQYILPSLSIPLPMPHPDKQFLMDPRTPSIIYGDIDYPFGLKKFPLLWSPKDNGFTCFYGSGRKGKSTTLKAIILSAMLQFSPSEVQFSVIDWTSGLVDVKNSPNVTSYVTPMEEDEELLSRLLWATENLIITRQKIMRANNLSTFTEYLEHKNRLPNPSVDPYGFFVLTIDGIGELLIKQDMKETYLARLQDIALNGHNYGVTILSSSSMDISRIDDKVMSRFLLKIDGGTTSGISIPQGFREKVNLMKDLPGMMITFNPDPKATDKYKLLYARSRIPSFIMPEPDEQYPDGTCRYDGFGKDYTAQTREVITECEQFWSEEKVAPIAPVPHLVELNTILDPVIESANGETVTLFGVDSDSLCAFTDEYPFITIVGELKSGKTSTLRTLAASVLEQKTKENTIVFFIEPTSNRYDLLNISRVFEKEHMSGGRIEKAEQLPALWEMLTEYTKDRVMEASDEVLSQEEALSAISDDIKDIYIIIDRIDSFDKKYFEGLVKLLNIINERSKVHVWITTSDNTYETESNRESTVVGALRKKWKSTTVFLSCPTFRTGYTIKGVPIKTRKARPGFAQIISQNEAAYNTVQIAYDPPWEAPKTQANYTTMFKQYLLDQGDNPLPNTTSTTLNNRSASSSFTGSSTDISSTPIQKSSNLANSIDDL